MDKPTARFDADTHAAQIREQGFTVIEDFMSPAVIEAVRAMPGSWPSSTGFCSPGIC